MESRLFSLCLLIDGFHWLRVGADGEILECAQCGFGTADDALQDFNDRFGQ